MTTPTVSELERLHEDRARIAEAVALLPAEDRDTVLAPTEALAITRRAVRVLDAQIAAQWNAQAILMRARLTTATTELAKHLRRACEVLPH